ncbi:hypothetical protein GLOIN_2v1829825 [Rhizophagus clarus]|uniref:Uncharacterized protein n=1 Tax=Rhizophagus clarus TaxID=94130 RepID=A0A8H3QJY4_9GLOM|nr:hypothetical protein GLOIN_2v1829825 [Rhizophagus clarus]
MEMEKDRNKTCNKYENLEKDLYNEYGNLEKDFPSGDDNEYEDLEKDSIKNDDEFKDLEKNLESVIDMQSELNNDKSLFEIDYDALANAKKFVQQNVSDKDEDDISVTESNEECEEEYDDEHVKVITKLQDNETLIPCVIISKQI